MIWDLTQGCVNFFGLVASHRILDHVGQVVGLRLEPGELPRVALRGQVAEVGLAGNPPVPIVGNAPVNLLEPLLGTRVRVTANRLAKGLS